MSHLFELDDAGLLHLDEFAVARREVLRLQELRVAHLAHIAARLQVAEDVLEVRHEGGESADRARRINKEGICIGSVVVNQCRLASNRISTTYECQ